MEKERKLLKEFSIVILIFVGLSLARMIADVIINGFTATSVVEGVSPEAMGVIAVVVWVLGIIFLLPEIYIGFKGIKVAKNPDNSKSHILIAKIIFVFLIIALISAIIEVFKTTDIAMSIITIADLILDVVIYILYIKYAKAVRNSNKQ